MDFPVSFHDSGKDSYFDNSDEEDVFHSLRGGVGKHDNDKKKVFEQRRAQAAAFLSKHGKDLSNLSTVTNTLSSKDHCEDEIKLIDDKDSLELFMEQVHATLDSNQMENNGSQNMLGRSCSDEILGQNDDDLADFIEAATLKAEADLLNEDEDEETENSNRSSDKPEVLPSINHEEMNYKPFDRDLYTLHKPINEMSLTDLTQFRESNRITISGYKVPQAVACFQHLKNLLQKRLLTNIQSEGWETPTPIQSQLIPVLLSGRNVIAVSETGSGKTGAFTIPCVQHTCKILDQWKMIEMPPGKGPISLILSPTRELALQTYRMVKKLADHLRLRVSCFSGGFDKTQQFKEIKRGLEICIANPGRLIDLVTMKGGLTLSDITLFILDEADRMLDLGFSSQVLSIYHGLRPDKQTILISATMSQTVIDLSNLIIQNPVKIVIGIEGQTATRVEQRPILFADEQQKLTWLLNNIHKLIRWNRQVLIFCKSHGRTIDLSAVINDTLQQHFQTTCTSQGQISQSNDHVIWDSDNTTNVEAHIEQPMIPSISKQDLSINEIHFAPAFARLSQNLSDSVSSRIDVLEKQHPDNTALLQTSTSHSIVKHPTFSTNYKKIYSRCLFGDMNQGERMTVLDSFRKKKYPILVASDVASRGLDIPSISTVINFDSATNYDTHIHRVGRTGRGNATGIAYTLLTRQDTKLACLIVEAMQDANQIVPKQILQFAMTYEPFKTTQLTGRSFQSHIRTRQDKRKIGSTPPAISSAGLGYGTKEFTDSTFFKDTQFVPGSSMKEQSSRVNIKRRWDSDETNNLPSVSSTENYDKTKQHIPPSIKRLAVSNSTLHIPSTTIAYHPISTFKKELKVFNPSDDISSSDSENEMTSTIRDVSKSSQTSSILRPRHNKLHMAQIAARAQAAIGLSKSRWDTQSSATSSSSSFLDLATRSNIPPPVNDLKKPKSWD